MTRVTDFLNGWIDDNYDFQGYPAEGGDDPQSNEMAEQCLIDADEEGVSKQEIEAEVGDLRKWMYDQLVRRADEHVKRQADKDD